MSLNPATGAARVEVVPGLVAFAFETLTVSTTALGGTVATFAPDGELPAQSVLISVETNTIRFRYDGGDPSAALGHALAAGASYLLQGAENIANLKMIRASADATVMLTYER
jgi:hypothetical protein